jgi:hypothetical protein
MLAPNTKTTTKHEAVYPYTIAIMAIFLGGEIYRTQTIYFAIEISLGF